MTRTPEGAVMHRAVLPAVLLGLLLVLPSIGADAPTPLNLTLRSRVKGDGGRYTVQEKAAAWDPKKTALVICDMWDDHWCKSAAARVGELTGPVDEAARAARGRGVLIVHAPSTVTDLYKDTPQRRRAREAPFAPTPVPLSADERWGTRWC